MRNYVMNRAHSLELDEGFPSLRRLWRHVKARRRVNRLGDLDDHMLRDIGVTRDEVQWAAGLPLTVNAALALEERAFQRRHFRSGC
jgi:uncharacterized protein YjiS (DUF1127 family)